MVRRQKEYDGDLRHLASMRTLLREACQESWGGGRADENRVQRLALALTEAGSNIILHSDQGQQRLSITLTIEVDDGQVRLTLQHTGQPFDPQATTEPVFDGSRENGFGLYLIRQCVDEVQYGQDDQGQCVLQLVLKRQQQKGEDHGASG